MSETETPYYIEIPHVKTNLRLKKKTAKSYIFLFLNLKF
jgi:hypothetical protein